VRPDLFERHPTRVDRVARGSGRKADEVKELLQKFTWMRDLMGNIGQQAGMLAKIPGVKQMAMARKMRDVIKTGGLGGLGGGMPGMEGLTDTMLEAAVASQPGFGGGGAAAPRSTKQRPAGSEQKRKDKRKSQRKARKKSRRR